jgi:hypothetical protein
VVAGHRSGDCLQGRVERGGNRLRGRRGKGSSEEGVFEAFTAQLVTFSVYPIIGTFMEVRICIEDNHMRGGAERGNYLVIANANDPPAAAAVVWLRFCSS